MRIPEGPSELRHNKLLERSIRTRTCWTEAAETESEHTKLLSESDESPTPTTPTTPTIERRQSAQEPDWLKSAADTLATTADVTAMAEAALKSSEETLGRMRDENEKLANQRRSAAVAVLAAAERHAEECEHAQAEVAAAHAHAQRAKLSAKATTAWSRLGSEAAKAAAQAEVDKVRAALAVQQAHEAARSNVTARWVRARAQAARKVSQEAHAEAEQAHAEAKRAQAALAVAEAKLEKMQGEHAQEAWMSDAMEVVAHRRRQSQRRLSRDQSVDLEAAGEGEACGTAPAPAFFAALAAQRRCLAQVAALEMDEVDAGVVELARRGWEGLCHHLGQLTVHLLACSAACGADLERCTADDVVHELRSRRREVLLGVPQAAAYAALGAAALLCHLLLFGVALIRVILRRGI
jgi:hypothetical protein